MRYARKATAETAVAFLRDLSCLATDALCATEVWMAPLYSGGMKGRSHGEWGRAGRTCMFSSVQICQLLKRTPGGHSFHLPLGRSCYILLRREHFMPYISKFPFCSLLPCRVLDLDGRIA